MIRKYTLTTFRFLQQGARAMEAEKLVITDLREKLPWNPRRGKWEKRPYSAIQGAIVHQSAGHARAASSPDVKCYNVEAINNYHISKECHIGSGQGCPRICYHFGIEPNGEVKLCNDFDDITWHAGSANYHYIGIVVCGNFSGKGWTGDQDPTDKQLDSLQLLLSWLLVKPEPALPEFRRRDQIFGHCEKSLGKPACPGYIIMDKIKEWRDN